MKVRSVIAQCLAAAGVDTLFGVLGRGNMFLVHDLVKQCGVRYVSASREDGAVLMAHGYAHATGRLGAATITSGPGFTNAITALTEAARSHTPMLVLTGELPAATVPDAIQAAQGIDQRRLADPTGVAYHRVRSAASVVEDVRGAIRTAILNQQCVALAVPADLREAETSSPVTPWALPQPSTTEPDSNALDDAVGVIASANRPVLLAGWGAVASGARPDLVALAKRLGAPVATTLRARGMFHGEPLDLGVFGTFSSDTTADVIRAADCVVAFGASLNPHTTAHGALVAGGRVVHCDNDPLAIESSCAVTAGLVGDVGTTVRAILRMLDDLGDEDRVPWPAALVQSGDAIGERSADADGGSIDPKVVLQKLDAELPSDRILVTDGGRFLLYTLEAMGAVDPRAFIAPFGFHAVGSGLATAVGASIGRPHETVVCVTGDGGLMMSLTELSTAVQHGLDLVVLVMNDGAYGQEIHLFEMAGMEPDLAFLQWPDFAPIAESFGAVGVTVRTPADVGAAISALRTRDRPFLVDVKVPTLSNGG